MLLKQNLLILLVVIFCSVPVIGGGKTEIEKLPLAGEGIVFPNHLLMKVSDRTDFFEYNNESEEYVLNFNQLITKGLKSIPNIFYDRIPSITILKTETVYFKSQIKNEYNFSRKWADKNNIISIKEFEKTGSESDLSSYLGPLSNISTASHGLATFDLKFEGSVVSFKSYAKKKLFSLRKQYWAYLDVYLPPKKVADQLRILILIVSEPNNYLKDNGTYFLIPITEDDRERYSIQ